MKKAPLAARLSQAEKPSATGAVGICAMGVAVVLPVVVAALDRGSGAGACRQERCDESHRQNLGHGGILFPRMNLQMDAKERARAGISPVAAMGALAHPAGR